MFMIKVVLYRDGLCHYTCVSASHGRVVNALKENMRNSDNTNTR